MVQYSGGSEPWAAAWGIPCMGSRAEDCSMDAGRSTVHPQTHSANSGELSFITTIPESRVSRLK